MENNVKKVRRVRDFFSSSSSSGVMHVCSKVNKWLEENEGKIEVVDFKIASAYNQRSESIVNTVLVDYYELQY